MKKQGRSRRLRAVGRVEHLETRSLLTMVATAPLADLDVNTNTPVTVNLDSSFKDSAATPDYAIFNTSLGTIPVLLTPATTPKTVANFQNYVNKGAYTNTVVHRSVPGFIWQAGGFQVTSTPSITTTPTDPPVQNEFSASNVRGTIAMAKLGSDPNSATDQFFFNESDSNASNLDNQNGGFTVFGHVVGASGLAVMDAIGNVPVPSPGPMAAPLDSIPIQNYKPSGGVLPSDLVVIKSVTTASEAFSANSDAPGVASASIAGNSLTVTPLANGTAHVTVVGYGSDGQPATETFTVKVTGVTQPAKATTSVLAVATRGTIAATATAGQKPHIQQAVTLTASSGAVTQKEQVTLRLSSTTTGSPGDITIGSTTANVRLKTGKQARLPLSARRLDPGLAPGTYHVLVSVTDPDGSMTTVDTMKTIVVQAPQAKPTKV